MSNIQIDYDSISEIYDLYVTADYDIPFCPLGWATMRLWTCSKADRQYL